MPHPLAQILSAMAEKHEQQEKPLPIIEVQRERLQEYFKDYKTAQLVSAKFKVGDLVRLNRLGNLKYNLPKSNQLAIVIDIFDRPLLGKDNDIATGIIGCITTCKECPVRVYQIDLALCEPDNREFDESLLQDVA